MRNLSDNNPNVELIFDEIFSKDTPHARQTLIMDIFSFNYTFLILATDKTKLEITLKYPLFSNCKSAKPDVIKEILNSVTPAALKDVLSYTTTNDCIVFNINIPNAKNCLKALKEFFSDVTTLFVTKCILRLGKEPNAYVIDDSSTLFFEEKEENYLLAYGYKSRNTLDKYLLSSMATEISNQRSKSGGGGCPSVNYIEPTTESKSTASNLLHKFKSEDVANSDSGFISFYINKKESTSESKVMTTIRLKTFIDFQMKGLRTMMNGKMRNAGTALSKVLARTTIVP